MNTIMSTIIVFLDIVLFLFKVHKVSETGFCLRLQVEPTQLGPIDRPSPYFLERRIQSPNRCVFNFKQDNG
jgi:hypothetical protein